MTGPLRFAGYAAIFHHEDRGGDVILPGAFARTLAAGPALPLLWQHRSERVAGRVEAAIEDDRGLRVIARVDDAEAAEMLAARAVTGLSFGYRVRRADGHRPRRLIALDLVEVSLVALPMQPLARVIALRRS